VYPQISQIYADFGEGLEKLLEYVALNFRIFKNLVKKPRPQCFTGVYGNDCCSPIGMTQKMVTTLGANDLEAGFLESLQRLPSGYAPKTDHTSTTTR